MYSGLLPSGLSEADLSSDEDPNDAQLTAKHREEETQTNLSCHTDLDTQSDLNANVGDDCLPGISLDQWQRFKDLQKAKHDQMSSQPQTKRQRRHKKGGTSKQNCDTGQNRKLEEERKDNWKELTQYFGINDRFQPPPSNRPPLMSGLEKSIEGAIAEGDYQKAEELSDRLATRELAVKIAQAADCRDFEHNKREAEASRAAQKRRKQIAWGFDAKKRWETKSNMGFM